MLHRNVIHNTWWVCYVTYVKSHRHVRGWVFNNVDRIGRNVEHLTGLHDPLGAPRSRQQRVLGQVTPKRICGKYAVRVLAHPKERLLVPTV